MQNYSPRQSQPTPYLKSIVLASSLSLLALTGCQTTTGMSQSGNQTTNPYGSSTPTTQPDTSVYDSSEYEDVMEESADSTTQSQTDNPFEPEQSPDNSPVVSQPNRTTIPQRHQPIEPAPVAEQPRPTNQKSARQILLEQARQNSGSTSRSSSSSEDGDNIPAFRRLMNTGVAQLRQGQVSAAQSTFTRAQRLAPQSSAVYYYLSQVAVAQNQPLKAEAMARRGLVVAKTTSRKQALWRLILKAGQAQGNQRVIKEANAALSR